MILFGAKGILICLDLERNASMIREGTCCENKAQVEDVDSIILRKYGCLVGPKWSASSMIIRRET